VIPYLKAILLNANEKSNRMLRAKAMECISLVGMAVGKAKFRDDAKQVIFNSFYSMLFVVFLFYSDNHVSDGNRVFIYYFMQFDCCSRFMC
jgi:hypothetical protein